MLSSRGISAFIDTNIICNTCLSKVIYMDVSFNKHVRVQVFFFLFFPFLLIGTCGARISVLVSRDVRVSYIYIYFAKN